MNKINIIKRLCQLSACIITMLLLPACQGNTKPESTELLSDSTMRAIDSICDDLAKVKPRVVHHHIKNPKGTIEETCWDLENDYYTPEEAAEMDSMNKTGGFLLIRGAERYLDTIVNHTRVVFITQE